VLYVSDSGLKPDFSSSGTDAVYRFEGNRAVVVLRDTALHAPNGLAVGPDGIIVVPFGAKTAWRIPAAGGSKTVAATLPAGQLDGVVRLADGSLVLSSWETKTVYHVTPQGEVHAILPDMESPADIGIDTKRNRVLIPLFTPNRVVVRGLH
jgi:sugar lactone lactonase YvrE